MRGRTPLAPKEWWWPLMTPEWKYVHQALEFLHGSKQGIDRSSPFFPLHKHETLYADSSTNYQVVDNIALLCQTTLSLSPVSAIGHHRI